MTTHRLDGRSALPTALFRGTGVGATRAIFGFALACVLLPILVAPILPSIDLYNHAARYFILSRLDTDRLFDSYYDSNWRLLPNVAMDVVGTWLFARVPVLAATKMLVAGVLVLQLAGVIAVRHALGARSIVPTTLLGANLAFSFVFTWGFLNFLLAVALSLLVIAGWIRLRDRLPVAIGFATIGGVAIFLAHGFAFALYGLTVAAVEFGLWRSEARRRSALLKRWGALILSAVPCAILFLVSRTAQRSGAGATIDNVKRLTHDGSLSGRLIEEAGYRLRTVLSVADSGSLALDVLLLGALIAVLVYATRRRVFVFDRRLLPAVAVLCVLAVVTPPALFGVGFVSDRIPLLVVLLACAGIDLGDRSRALATPALIALGAILLVRTAGLVLLWQSYSADARDFHRVMQVLPRDIPVSSIFLTGSTSRERRFARRCEMWAPLAGPLYHLVPSLFAEADAQPLVASRAIIRGRDLFRRWQHEAAFRASATNVDGVALACGAAPPAFAASVMRNAYARQGRFAAFVTHSPR